MLIDWFTVIAQVINFLILAWLLKRFLYRPILDAIDTREQRIASELADADKKSIEAEQQRDEFKNKNMTFDKDKTQRNNELVSQVKDERTRLLEEVRQEADNLRGKLQLALKNDQLSLQTALSQRTRDEVFAIVRKVLNDLADTHLEERITAVFIQRLQTLSNEELTEFKSAVSHAGSAIKNPLIIRSAFTLPKKQCTLIEAAIKSIFCRHSAGENSVENDAENGIKNSDEIVDQITLQFVIDPALVSGIEINANGQKIAWSINNYLTSLAKGVDDILQSLGNEQTEEVDNKQSNNEKNKQTENNVMIPKTTLKQTEQDSHENRD